jgi:hypothetical protein
MLSIHTTPNRQEDIELWWQDRYDEIAEHGYQLRPRLHVVKEDGQPTMVSYVLTAVVFSSSAYAGNSWVL